MKHAFIEMFSIHEKDIDLKVKEELGTYQMLLCPSHLDQTFENKHDTWRQRYIRVLQKLEILQKKSI